MSAPKFPKIIDYDALKRQYGESLDLTLTHNHRTSHTDNTATSTHTFDEAPIEPLAPHKIDIETHDDNPPQSKLGTLTGTRLRSYAFALLTRKEYSKKDLLDKLSQYALNRDEVIELVNELAQENYQSDQRVAEMTVRSQIRKGKGPNRIKLALQAKSIDKTLAQNDIEDIDWYEQAYALKVKKYGTEVAKDPKIKAKQIRFLQYRGFEMDSIIKAIQKRAEDD